MEKQLLEKAFQGDINAYQQLFANFQNQLRSYLFRLTANRNDAEDLTHDTFIRGFDHISGFRGESSFKAWVFRIATNLAYDLLQKRKRWATDTNTPAKYLVRENKALQQEIISVSQNATYAIYDIKEHIDTCFTCMSKSLPIENQVALILKDVYDFPVQDICLILSKTEGVVKYLLQDGRGTMMDIFDQRCALVNKKGVCNQCSELNGWFNPKQDQQEALMKLDLVKGSAKFNRDQLYTLRANLVKAIDPLRSEGHELQEVLMKCNRLAMGE